MYKHGVRFSELSTSIVPPSEATAGLPIVLGTAPINLAENQDYVNKPLLAFNYGESVKALGYSSNWNDFTLCEFMKSQFQLFNVGPTVFINVLDPTKHKTDVTDSTENITDDVVKINQFGVLLNTLVVKNLATGDPLAKDTDYTAAFDSNGYVVITRIEGGAITSSQTSIVVSYSYLDESKVTNADIIGGVDAVTGKATGLELINQVFPLFRLVPGQIVIPKWSKDPVVAAVMKAKSTNINGLFKAISLADIDSSSDGADIYSEVPAWKNDNNITDPLQVPLWPKIKLGDDIYHLSTQAAGVICLTDSENDDIPYVSPSNKSLQANGAVLEDGSEVSLGPDQAGYLNGEGIVTALNFIGGWKLWGNRTAAYPSNTDVKDSMLAVRRMFNWIGNTIILTYWQKVDDPTNPRLIDSVTDSINIWLNGLTARGALLGGRVEFRPEENPKTDLLDGMVRFHIFLTPPVPAKDIEFMLEFDTSYLNGLFS